MKKATSIKIAASSDELAAEYRAGATLRELAAKHGCSFQNINARLHTAGVVMRPLGAAKQIPDKVCPTCGTIFTTSYRDQVFCRQECVRIKDTCVHGHALTEDNRYHYPGGNSRCRICHHRRVKAYSERRKAAS